MLAGGFIVWPGSIIKNYGVNSSGIILNGGQIPGYFRWQFADIVNRVSINATPFRSLAVTISGYGGDYQGDRDIKFNIYLYKSDKKTSKGSLESGRISRNPERHVFDISSINEQIYLRISPYLLNESYIEYSQVIIHKIEFLTS